MLDLHHPDLQPGHIELCGRIATSAHKGLTEIRATKFAQEEAWRFLQREQQGDREDREDREEDQEDRNGKDENGVGRSQEDRYQLGPHSLQDHDQHPRRQ